MKNLITGVVLGAVIVVGAFSIRDFQSTPKTLESAPPKVAGTQVAETSALSKMVVHKSPKCGCCGNYVSYLRREGYEVEVMDHDDMNPIKDQYGIPSGMQSCHTTVIGDYVSEGHVPLESIAKMMNEEPKIAGITMPGMPAGAPGMGGAKNKPFTIYGFTADGEISTFDEQ